MEKNKDMNPTSAEILEAEIRSGKYPIYLQSQVDIDTEAVVGAEALIRKVNEDGTICMPDTFIPYYEAEGIISLIDIYVFEEMVKLLKAEESKLSDSFTISINFSRVTLQEKGIISKIVSICKTNGVAPSKLYIEITETMDAMAMKELVTLSREIKGAGFKLALDDFGKGYSNTMILANIEFDEVKLDKSLVMSSSENPKAKSIMSTIINMCQGFQNTHIVAEGIETKEILDILREFSCHYGQGYYFSHPVSVEKFIKNTSTA